MKEFKPFNQNEEPQELVRSFVNHVYENADQPLEKKEAFKLHNETILNYAEALAEEENLSPEDLKILKMAAELHDVSKFDVPLVKHGIESAKIAREKLRELSFSAGDIEKVASAIERHMGPLPGFMADAAKKWEEKTGEKIEFPRPENEVDRQLYDADMLSLIDEGGINKILKIRATEKWAQDEDQKIAAEKGITQEEVAWLSALKSGQEAAASLFTESAKKKGKELLDKAQKSFEAFKTPRQQ